MRLIEQLTQAPFTIIVSLPKNDVALAKAALDAGADALKVHIQVEHRASGTRFGSLAEEHASIEAILFISDRPVGLVPGAEHFATPDELARAADMGIDFIDAYTHHLPVRSLSTGLTLMAALDHTFTSSDAAALHDMPFVHCIEASVVHAEGYGRPLTLADLVNYRQIAYAGPKPVIVPTQRAIAPDDVGRMAEAGVRGVILGAVVTGVTPDGVAAAVRAFRRAVDGL